MERANGDNQERCRGDQSDGQRAASGIAGEVADGHPHEVTPANGHGRPDGARAKPGPRQGQRRDQHHGPGPEEHAGLHLIPKSSRRQPKRDRPYEHDPGQPAGKSRPAADPGALVAYLTRQELAG